MSNLGIKRVAARHPGSTMIENITYQNTLLALIVSHRFEQPGIHFFTPAELSQQLACMNYPAGKVIPAHVHNLVHRDVFYTQDGRIQKLQELQERVFSDQ